MCRHPLPGCIAESFHYLSLPVEYLFDRRGTVFLVNRLQTKDDGELLQF